MIVSRHVLPSVLLAATTALVGCTAQDRPPVTPSCEAEPFPPPHAQIPPCSGVDVLQGSVGTLYRLDPSAGIDPRSAFDTARPLMSPAFVVHAGPGASMWSPITVSEWQAWVDARIAVASTVEVTADDHPPDTATSTARVLAVHLTPAGGSPVDFAVYARAIRSGAESRWLLTDLKVLS
ncbi:hypothetical protein [Nocardia sp. NPDC058497]|uniref:hypothetical protein n=1 Tax=Nocardia sp. NPDC058497 TaxID=3346529 RepID=UPI003649E43B